MKPTTAYLIALLALNGVLAMAAGAEPPKTEPNAEFTDPLTGMRFVTVKGGCFQMGCGKWFWGSNCETDEKPVRRICLDTFLIGRYEVTQRQWERVMGDNPASGRDCGLDCPVEMVSWEDVGEFIARLNAGHNGRFRFRLPTEAEWEYACRSGGNPETFCGGNDNAQVAWYLVTSGGRSHPVGTKQPNGLGIYDMSGNVWEWCADYYDVYAPTDLLNPKGPAEGRTRVIRGGGWGDYFSRFCRSAFRGQYLPHLKSKFIGFRLVAFPPEH